MKSLKSHWRLIDDESQFMKRIDWQYKLIMVTELWTYRLMDRQRWLLSHYNNWKSEEGVFFFILQIIITDVVC